ncbi:MAG: N-succinylarginine dihydrolase [Phycisphaerales bacterium]|nr:N-succinylarginine dihydrolase [Planctomycetota bacterium]MCH8509379.1 N-succinylarginine dihydrolase [Phycisphaerales bacterium]
MAHEVNFDGLIGPTHNYAGLSRGNVASASNAGGASSPKQAALQGLAKMRFMAGLGLKQGVLPPQQRPDLGVLRRLGFTGDDQKILRDAEEADPTLLAAVWSASSMWAANAATVSPSADTADAKVHFTPANLASNFHRSLEPATTTRALRMIFADERRFTVHDPLPCQARYSDEGAANHMRFAPEHGKPGVELFVYGIDGHDPTITTRRFPTRQTRAACEAIARLHRLDPERVVFARQHPDAIDAGVFHNDVIATSNANVFLFHEQAFATPRSMITDVAGPLDCRPHPVEARGVDFSIREAVSSYIFNSQIVTMPDGSMTLVAPEEVREHKRVHAFVDRVIDDPSNPIARVEYIDVRESMRNGGGPACLRLRVVMTDEELAAVNRSVLFTDDLDRRLTAWIEKHYPDTLTLKDLTDPRLARNCLDALDELTGILGLPDLYPFQR